MIRLIIFCTGFCLIFSGCSTPIKDTSSNQFEVQTVVVDKNAPKTPIPVPGALPNITGTWKSTHPEPAGNGNYLVREYRFTIGHWEMTNTLAADKAMKNLIYVYRADGSYILNRSSKKVPGAFEALFKYGRKYLALKSRDRQFISELGFDHCRQIQPDKETDISTLGCASFKSLGECPQDFDLVKLEDSSLRLGERPSDNGLCSAEARPEGLGPHLTKVQ